MGTKDDLFWALLVERYATGGRLKVTKRQFTKELVDYKLNQVELDEWWSGLRARRNDQKTKDEIKKIKTIIPRRNPLK